MDLTRCPRPCLARQALGDGVPQRRARVGEGDGISHEKRPRHVIRLEIVPLFTEPAAILADILRDEGCKGGLGSHRRNGNVDETSEHA